MKGSNKKQYRNRKSKGNSNDFKRNNRNKDEGRENQISADPRQSGYMPGEVNDFDWYNHNPSLTAGVASVQYPFRPGMKIPVIGNNNTTIPGICKITWVPTIGQSTDNQSPIGIAAREMYGRVRAAYSGTLRADAPDMMIYVQALDSIYAYISWLKRLYRMVNAQSPDNYIIPDTLLMSLNFTQSQCSELRRDKMKLFNAVNVLVGMTDKFRVPDVYPLLRRHVWMNDRVYTDSPSLNAQLYLFDMIRMYKFELKNTPDKVLAGGLTMVARPVFGTVTPGTLVDTLYNFGEQLISALAASETAYTISGYLERAYEGTRLFTLDTLVLEERLDFTYNEVVLSQIENANVPSTDFGLTAGSNDVTQDPKTNALLCAPTVMATSISYRSPFINIHNDAPTIQDTVEATRLKNCVLDSAGHILCSTEITFGISIYMPYPDGTAVQRFTIPDTITFTDTNIADVSNALQGMILASTFDWHPFSAVEYDVGDTTSYYIFGDIQDYTILTVDELTQLHRVCELSEYNCFNGI